MPATVNSDPSQKFTLKPKVWFIPFYCNSLNWLNIQIPICPNFQGSLHILLLLPNILLLLLLILLLLLHFCLLQHIVKLFVASTTNFMYELSNMQFA